MMKQAFSIKPMLVLANITIKKELEKTAHAPVDIQKMDILK